MQPLDPRARVLFHLQAFSRLLVFWVPMTTLATGVSSLFISPLTAILVGLGWLFLLFITAVWYPAYAFDRWGYALGDDELLIQRGVFFRSVTAIPTQRIQHVDTRQGPLEQWMGLGRLQLYTASGVGADGVIPGLDIDDAEALRDRLVAVVDADDGV